jgi:hypothetical protein
MSDLNPMDQRRPFAMISVPDNSVDTPDQRKVSGVPSQWHKPPEELKRDIFAYLIPQKQSFKFVPDSLTQKLNWITTSVKEPQWSIHARDIESTGNWLDVINKEPHRPLLSARMRPPQHEPHRASDSPPMARMLRTYAILLRVKVFADEAKGPWFSFSVNSKISDSLLQSSQY